ncbi:TRAP transporter small permease [Vibrio sp. ZSDZ65]|uniref:TRAP transporter small permease protein n=1 Tax=Vibrio qingdaonensis TaxID=2829491 RepID=A0A9X3CLY4_9VIBR|nr:TRAP transporter small permease [Vibrio qingdaonensis]MCW8345884.1 TRAP transporter small permease [Vibrio qingdaonensis]
MTNLKQGKFFAALSWIRSWVDRILSWLLISIVGIMTALVTYQVIARYVFNSPSAVSEVLSRYLFIWLVLLGAAFVFGLREHMAITFVKDKLSHKVRTLVEIVIESVTAIFAFTVMFTGGYSSAIRQMWQIDSALQIPMGVIYSVIPIAGGLILFYVVINVINLFIELFSPPSLTEGDA